MLSPGWLQGSQNRQERAAKGTEETEETRIVTRAVQWAGPS